MVGVVEWRERKKGEESRAERTQRGQIRCLREIINDVASQRKEEGSSLDGAPTPSTSVVAFLLSIVVARRVKGPRVP